MHCRVCGEVFGSSTIARDLYSDKVASLELSSGQKTVILRTSLHLSAVCRSGAQCAYRADRVWGATADSTVKIDSGDTCAGRTEHPIEGPQRARKDWARIWTASSVAGSSCVSLIYARFTPCGLAGGDQGLQYGGLLFTSLWREEFERGRHGRALANPLRGIVGSGIIVLGNRCKRHRLIRNNRWQPLLPRRPSEIWSEKADGWRDVMHGGAVRSQLP